MAIPRVFPPYANFRKPLPNHVEIAFVAGAVKDLRKLVVESHTEPRGRVGRNRFGQGHLKDGTVVHVIVIGMDEFHFAGEIAGTLDLEFAHRDSPAMLIVPASVGSGATGSGDAGFGHESRLRLKSIQI